MLTYYNLLEKYKKSAERQAFKDPVHASLAAYPSRIDGLKASVMSVVNQVDTLHVFLNEFEVIPEFLNHERIFVTRSQDFGKLGECGKYYWTDDLEGYHFICSDRLIYPSGYVDHMIGKIEHFQRKMVVAAGGYLLRLPFRDFSSSAECLCETAEISADIQVPIVSDLSVAYHSATIRVSRHHFYQPELSNLWLSIIGLEQQIPFFCVAHPEHWIVASNPGLDLQFDVVSKPDYRSFLVKSYFIGSDSEQIEPKSLNINSVFDRIFVMNLDRRPDRWEKISKIATTHQIKLSRFPAVDGYREPIRSEWESYFKTQNQVIPPGIEPLVDFTDKFTRYHHYIARIHFMEEKLKRKAIQSPGAYGYNKSYIEILKQAINSDFQRILILDDDIILHKSFTIEFEKYYHTLPDNWKLIMLGAMQHNWEPWITQYSDFLYHCHGSSVASHAVGIARKMFLPMLFYAEKLDLPIDEGAVFHVQNVYDKQCFIFRPNLIIQDMGESDISSSAMKHEDTERWMKLFRWNLEDYDLNDNPNN